jgi:hypothetical protein
LAAQAVCKACGEPVRAGDARPRPKLDG